MPRHTNMTEQEVLEFIFKENSPQSKGEQNKNINTYYAIKHHMPSSIFNSEKLSFNYNKGVSYIKASYDETELFKIPNNSEKQIEIICPPDKDYVKSLEISDTKKDAVLKKYKDTRAKVWYLKLKPDEVLYFSSKHWEGFTNLLNDLTKK